MKPLLAGAAVYVWINIIFWIAVWLAGGERPSIWLSFMFCCAQALGGVFSVMAYNDMADKK